MWPLLLNLTQDECRLTLRRLELEAYSNMISVFRAQGALEDNRKKMLEELRAVLHISNDRHSAEARRVANDELLATIAEQIAGPNTGIGWLKEGRRKIPLMPRGIAQTAFTEIADKAAEEAAAENRDIKKKLEAEKLAAPKTDEEELSEAESQTAESVVQNSNDIDELLYPPIAMEDQATKLWETELICRKRKLPEGGSIPDETSTPVKNVRNIPENTKQKHLNLSQIYSKLSQPQSTSKSLGLTKHSYNQVSKVSTSKSNQSHASRSSSHKSRKNSKNSAQIVIPKSQVKKPEAFQNSHNKQPLYNHSVSLNLDYTGPPSSFQASYAQSVLGNKNKHDYVDEMKPQVLSSPTMLPDTPKMQFLTQPTTMPHEIDVSDSTHSVEPPSLQAENTSKPTAAGKACHLIIKRSETINKKVPMSEVKILQKPVESVKVLSNRQVVVAPSSAQKALNATGKLVTTKVIGSMPRSQTSTPTILSDKMIIVSKPVSENKPKIFITSSAISTHNKDVIAVSSSNVSPKINETLMPKGVPATELKVSAKTFVLNPKSGQKMVVVPASTRTKQAADGQVPLIHFKGIPTAMKLVPVSCQAITQITKTPTMSVVSKTSVVNALSSNKMGGVESIKTANMADIVPIKGLTPTPKTTIPITRPATGKGVIVVQKGTTIGKALSFTKNGNDMSKIIMGKNVNQLLQASKPNQSEAAKCPGNVIVLELNNDQLGRTTTMSEILESRDANSTRIADETNKIPQQITQDTPVLFDNQMTEEICAASSLDSATESIGDIIPIEESTCLPPIEKEDEDKSNFSKNTKDSSSVTDWEIELDTVSRKEKDDDDKLNSLHLELGISSESDSEYIVDTHSIKSKHSSQESLPKATSSRAADIYSTSSMSLATRTLLSQLQDEGSSSNDSSFLLKSKPIEKKDVVSKLDKSESEELTKAKEKLSEKVAEAKSQLKRIDVYSTAIISSEINLESFSYLDDDDNIMVGDDEFTNDSKTREERRIALIDEQFNRLLAEDSANSTDSQTVNDNISLSKK